MKLKPLPKSAWLPLSRLGLLGLLVFSIAIVANREGFAQGCCLLPTVAQVSQIQSQASAFDPAQYQGKVLVVNFMAEWCTGCWAELPGLVNLYQEFKSRGVAFVGISVQSSKEGTQNLIKQFGISYPVYLDPDGKLAVGRYRLTGMPSTLIYDKNGKLVKSLRGKVSSSVLRAIVEGLL